MTLAKFSEHSDNREKLMEGRSLGAVANLSRSSERRAEQLLMDLLTSQGWDVRKPPRGNVYQQQEYKDNADLADALASASKSGLSAGLPEAILVSSSASTPLAVVEAKAAEKDIDKAVLEAKGYAKALIDAGSLPLAIGIAGTESQAFKLEVHKWTGSEWEPVTYEGWPINWIPNENDILRVANPTGPSELRPSIPPAEVLAAKADEINRLFREADI